MNQKNFLTTLALAALLSLPVKADMPLPQLHRDLNLFHFTCMESRLSPINPTTNETWFAAQELYVNGRSASSIIEEIQEWRKKARDIKQEISWEPEKNSNLNFLKPPVHDNRPSITEPSRLNKHVVSLLYHSNNQETSPLVLSKITPPTSPSASAQDMTPGSSLPLVNSLHPPLASLNLLPSTSLNDRAIIPSSLNHLVQENVKVPFQRNLLSFPIISKTKEVIAFADGFLMFLQQDKQLMDFLWKNISIKADNIRKGRILVLRERTPERDKQLLKDVFANIYQLLEQMTQPQKLSAWNFLVTAYKRYGLYVKYITAQHFLDSQKYSSLNHLLPVIGIPQGNTKNLLLSLNKLIEYPLPRERKILFLNERFSLDENSLDKDLFTFSSADLSLIRLLENCALKRISSEIYGAQHKNLVEMPNVSEPLKMLQLTAKEFTPQPASHLLPSLNRLIPPAVLLPKEFFKPDSLLRMDCVPYIPSLDNLFLLSHHEVPSSTDHPQKEKEAPIAEFPVLPEVRNSSKVTPHNFSTRSKQDTSTAETVVARKPLTPIQPQRTPLNNIGNVKSIGKGKKNSPVIHKKEKKIGHKIDDVDYIENFFKENLKVASNIPQNIRVNAALFKDGRRAPYSSPVPRRQSRERSQSTPSSPNSWVAKSTPAKSSKNINIDKNLTLSFNSTPLDENLPKKNTDVLNNTAPSQSIDSLERQKISSSPLTSTTVTQKKDTSLLPEDKESPNNLSSLTQEETREISHVPNTSESMSKKCLDEDILVQAVKKHKEGISKLQGVFHKRYVDVANYSRNFEVYCSSSNKKIDKNTLDNLWKEYEEDQEFLKKTKEKLNNFIIEENKKNTVLVNEKLKRLMEEQENLIEKTTKTLKGREKRLNQLQELYEKNAQEQKSSQNLSSSMKEDNGKDALNNQTESDKKITEFLMKLAVEESSTPIKNDKNGEDAFNNQTERDKEITESLMKLAVEESSTPIKNDKNGESGRGQEGKKEEGKSSAWFSWLLNVIPR